MKKTIFTILLCFIISLSAFAQEENLWIAVFEKTEYAIRISKFQICPNEEKIAYIYELAAIWGDNATKKKR